MRDTFLKRRDLFLRLLEGTPGLKLNVPEGAFYIFPDVSAYFGKSYNGFTVKNGVDVVEYLLDYAHVATVDGESFGDDNCIRLSYAASEETLIEAAKRIREALVKLV